MGELTHEIGLEPIDPLGASSDRFVGKKLVGCRRKLVLGMANLTMCQTSAPSSIPFCRRPAGAGCRALCPERADRERSQNGGDCQNTSDFRNQRRLGACHPPCVPPPFPPLSASWPFPSTDPPKPAHWRISTRDRAKSSAASSSPIFRPASRSDRGTCRACCRSRCRRPPCAT